MFHLVIYIYFFFFNDTATTEIYTLSLHDALPILPFYQDVPAYEAVRRFDPALKEEAQSIDRKSTRLNSSHVEISYAVFCLKKKKKHPPQYTTSQRSQDCPHPLSTTKISCPF